MTTPDETHGPAGRTLPRHTFEARIKILLERDGQSLTVQGWTRNLSEGGVNAFVAHRLSLGEFVMLAIPFPDAPRMTSRPRLFVRWGPNMDSSSPP
jgi:hypothetical protein